MADTYPHTTREYVYPVVRDNGTIVTTGVDFAIVQAGTTPSDGDWSPAALVDGKTAAWIRDLPPGPRTIYARVTDGEQLIVLAGPTITLT